MPATARKSTAMSQQLAIKKLKIMNQRKENREAIQKVLDILTKQEEENSELKSKLLKLQRKYESIKVLTTYFKSKLNNLISDEESESEEEDIHHDSPSSLTQESPPQTSTIMTSKLF